MNINGRMHVNTLKAQFQEEFGLSIRVYDGRSFADESATLASIRKGDCKGGDFSPKKNTKVGNLEDKFMELFGLKTQITGSDDSYLCENDLTLSKAKEADNKKMQRKEKKVKANSIKDNNNKEDASDNSKYDSIIDSDAIQDLLEGLENKVMETGLLTDLIGLDNGFEVGICLEEYGDDGEIKLIVDISYDEDEDLEITSGAVEDISDRVLDYANGRFELSEILEKAGVEDAIEMVNWAPVTFNGSVLDLDDDDGW